MSAGDPGRDGDLRETVVKGQGKVNRGEQGERTEGERKTGHRRDRPKGTETRGHRKGKGMPRDGTQSVGLARQEGIGDEAANGGVANERTEYWRPR